MTYLPTSATFPALAESILGPIFIGLTTMSREAEVIDEVWHTAADSVPTTMPVLNVQVGKAAQQVKHRRRVLTATGTDCLKLAQLCDIRGEEPFDQSWDRWQWMVAAKAISNNAARQLVGSDRTSIRVDVASYRLRAGKVVCAQQLALFRHYLVVGFQACDPNVVVLGGQYGWQDNWWLTSDSSGSARAAASGSAIPGSELEKSCQSAILKHERTQPGETQFVAFLQPLAFFDGGRRIRTPISLGITQRSLGISRKGRPDDAGEKELSISIFGKLEATVTTFIDRRDIKAGLINAGPGEFSYSIDTPSARFTFQLKSREDLSLLESWVQANVRQVGGAAQ